MVVLVTKWFGAFLVEDGRVKQEARFPLASRAIADRLRSMRKGEILEEERKLAGSGLEVLEPRLKPLGTWNDKRGFYDVDVPEPDRAILHEACLLVAREDSRSAAGERDRFVAQAVRAMDEITKTVNTLMERAREWYGLHFPEAVARVPDAHEFARQIARHPRREDLVKALPALAGIETIGVDLGPEELESIRTFAEGLERLHQERARLESLVAREAREIAPTLSHVVGDVIAARLISKAGSLERLANVPSSTLQTLGAETALFQHFKEGTKPPKHGILFQHGLVNTAPWWQRGKLARILAGKAQLAARLDYFGHPGPAEGERLLAEVEAGVKRVREAYPRPRPRPAPRRGPPLRAAARPGGRRR